jgi:hypothetical protein
MGRDKLGEEMDETLCEVVDWTEINEDWTLFLALVIMGSIKGEKSDDQLSECELPKTCRYFTSCSYCSKGEVAPAPNRRAIKQCILSGSVACLL